MQTNTQRIAVLLAALVLIGLPFAVVAQDHGFEIIYEGVVDSENESTGQEEPGGARFDASLYGLAGFSGGGAFWGSAGACAAFAVRGFAIEVDAGIGLDGVLVQAGAQTEISGFGLAGGVTWSPGNTPIVDLRGWGALDTFRLIASVRLAGTATSFAFGGTTQFGDLGASATVSYAGGTLTQATLGVNTQLGDLVVSGSAGLSSGQVSVSAGAGIQLETFNLTASAGYDGGLGVNAMAGGGLTLGTFNLTAVGLYDNTGIGGEARGEFLLGQTVLSFMGRFSPGNISFEVGGQFALGPAHATASVALDGVNGFGWAEIGLELPF